MSPYIASTDQHRHSSWSLWVFTSFGQNSRGWGWLISKSTNQWISTQSVFLNIGPVCFGLLVAKYTHTNENTQILILIHKYTIHQFEHGSGFLLSVRQLPNKLTVGHIGDPWALGRQKTRWIWRKKIIIILGDISQSMRSSVFSIGDVAVKSFTTIFISIQITPIFSSHEIPKQCHMKTICITGI